MHTYPPREKNQEVESLGLGILSLLCFSLYIIHFALSPLQTHSVLLRPQPAGLEFSVDLLSLSSEIVAYVKVRV